MPQPLLPNPYTAGSQTYQAYDTCLAFQDANVKAPWKSGPPSLVCARLLGYMIIYSPTDQGRTNIANEINSCNGVLDQLHHLAKFYVDRYLRSCERPYVFWMVLPLIFCVCSLMSSQTKQRSYPCGIQSSFQAVVWWNTGDNEVLTWRATHKPWRCKSCGTHVFFNH